MNTEHRDPAPLRTYEELFSTGVALDETVTLDREQLMRAIELLRRAQGQPTSGDGGPHGQHRPPHGASASAD